MVRRFFLFFFLIPLAVLQMGCANWLTRKNCAAQDWSRHGYDAAMEGRSLKEDALAEKCRKAGFEVPEEKMKSGYQSGLVNYCEPEAVYEAGKKGEDFDSDRCDSKQTEKLTLRHKEGVYLYCALDNGQIAGASGRKYLGLCPGGMERGFLKEFAKGRKKFLNGRIKQNQKEIRRMSQQVLDLQHRSADLSFQYGMLPGPRDHEGDVASADRQRLSADINRTGLDIQEKKAKQAALKKQIQEDQNELTDLED